VNADLAALRALLTDNAVLEMPPFFNWSSGADDYVRFIARVYAIRGTDWRMAPTGANGQPAVAAYVRTPGGGYALHTVQVFTVTQASVSHTVAFQDPTVFALFGLDRSAE
jgi:RNA polymerase sigma-70 factor, ECF subfamily